MYKSLMADMIGIDVDPLGSVEFARKYGFQGVDLRLDKQEARIREIGAEVLSSAIRDAGLRPGYCSILPGKVSCDEKTWREGVARLPALAGLAERLGFTRTATVVLPFDDEQPFDSFFGLHTDRIKQAAPVLADHGLSLAMEYVSPITRRAGHKHPFVYEMKGLRELCRASGHANVGLLLDSFHWHCAGETVADIEALSADEVVVVHVNDLIADLPVDRQVVTERALPCETGVIDLAGFIGALDGIGYAGPITSEPTHPKWGETDPDRAAAELAESMDKMMALVSA
jgi:sugar phosphate isomerase/epimerase